MHPSIAIILLGYQVHKDKSPTLDFLPDEQDHAPINLEQNYQDKGLDARDRERSKRSVRPSRIQKVADHIRSVNAKLMSEYKEQSKA